MDFTQSEGRVVIRLDAGEVERLESGGVVIASNGLNGGNSMTALSTDASEFGPDANVSKRGDLSVKLPAAILPAVIENHHISGAGVSRFIGRPFGEIAIEG